MNDMTAVPTDMAGDAGTAPTSPRSESGGAAARLPHRPETVPVLPSGWRLAASRGWVPGSWDGPF